MWSPRFTPPTPPSPLSLTLQHLCLNAEGGEPGANAQPHRGGVVGGCGTLVLMETASRKWPSGSEASWVRFTLTWAYARGCSRVGSVETGDAALCFGKPFVHVLLKRNAEREPELHLFATFWISTARESWAFCRFWEWSIDVCCRSPSDSYTVWKTFILFPACCTHAHHMPYIQIWTCEFGMLNLMMMVMMSMSSHRECLKIRFHSLILH